MNFAYIWWYYSLPSGPTHFYEWSKSPKLYNLENKTKSKSYLMKMFKYGITNDNALPTMCRAYEILQHFKYITKLYVDCDSL